MNSEVDQFGRSANNSDGLSDDKSKRILEALSDIKNQLQNDEFVFLKFKYENSQIRT
jgi:hypothetical protein